MPSPFSHAVAGLAAATTVRFTPTPKRFWVFAAICGSLPDVDIAWSSFAVPWNSMWGHRGLTHGLFFAVALGAAVAWLGFPGTYWRGFRGRLWLAFALATATHGFLDAMSTHSGGIAFFAPLSPRRFVFPWRPLTGPPPAFQGSLAMQVVWVAGTEFLGVWVPALLLMIGTLRAKRPRS